MDLVDHSRPLDIGDEPRRVGPCRVRRQFVIEIEDPRPVLAGGEVSNQGALSDLTGPQQCRGATLPERLEHQGTDVTFDKAGWHEGHIVTRLRDRS